MGLVGDERGQSVQIGAVLLFAVLIVSFSGYQAFVVPNQNRQVEFNHFTQTQAEMEDLRNGVIEAGQTGRTVPVDVRLGTEYPARLIAAQPAGSDGTLRTATIGDSTNEIELRRTDADITDICGIDSPTTRTATYRPGYSYLDSVGNISYENTVVYTSGAFSGQSFQAEQQLVDGDTIHLYPLVGEFDEGGRGTATVTLKGGVTGVNSSVSGEFDLILPTRLSAGQWEDLLDDEGLDVAPVGGDRQAVEITFPAGTTYEIRCSPAGAGEAPGNEPTTGGDSDSLNPNFGNDVVLEDVSSPGDPNVVELQLRNTNENDYQNITSVRFPFYSASAQSGSGVTLPESMKFGGTVAERVGGLEPVDIKFQPGETRTITVEFYCNADGTGEYDVRDGDFFVWNAFFGADKDRTYFAAIDDAGSSGSSRCSGGNQAPTASFTAEPDPANVDQSITLDAGDSSDPDGSIVSYEWDTDDDGAYDDLSGESVSTSYSSSGDKPISLRVTDNDGATGTASQTVTVGSGGGGSASPSVTDADGYPGDGNKYQVDYSATDSDGDLSEVSVILEDSSGTDIDVVEVLSPSDPQTGSVSGTVSVKDTGSNSPAQVRVIARDAAGNEDSQVDTDIENQN
ncbi:MULTISPECIES: PKD domain-containing protein [Haloarcula]|uniref:PKD domain-containing protein n=1 Tax=Haloarcula TaxID=2237 RepID=UPI0023EBCBA7|nr:PKD domain-containing protein [Halomicroarcula sp. XH51]